MTSVYSTKIGFDQVPPIVILMYTTAASTMTYVKAEYVMAWCIGANVISEGLLSDSNKLILGVLFLGCSTLVCSCSPLPSRVF